MKVRIWDRDPLSCLGGEGGRAEGCLILPLVVAEEEEGVMREEEDVMGALGVGCCKLGLEPRVLFAVVFLRLKVRNRGEGGNPLLCLLPPFQPFPPHIYSFPSFLFFCLFMLLSK